MNNCLINNGRFLGYRGDRNVKGMSGRTISDVNLMTVAERQQEGLYRTVKQTKYPTYEVETPEGKATVTVESKYCKRIGEDKVVDRETATYTVTVQYGLRSAEDILELRLEELKQLRKAAVSTGFYYNGHFVIADRDAQNDLSNIVSQYERGLVPASHFYRYKMGNGDFVTLNHDKDKKAKTGLAGVMDLAKYMIQFIQLQCFNREDQLTTAWKEMTNKELVKLDPRELFQPDIYMGQTPPAVDMAE